MSDPSSLPSLVLSGSVSGLNIAASFFLILLGSQAFQFPFLRVVSGWHYVCNWIWRKFMELTASTSIRRGYSGDSLRKSIDDSPTSLLDFLVLRGYDLGHLSNLTLQRSVFFNDFAVAGVGGGRWAVRQVDSGSIGVGHPLAPSSTRFQGRRFPGLP